MTQMQPHKLSLKDGGSVGIDKLATKALCKQLMLGYMLGTIRLYLD